MQFCNLREIENVGFSQTKSETHGLKDGALNVSRSNDVYTFFGMYNPSNEILVYLLYCRPRFISITNV